VLPAEVLVVQRLALEGLAVEGLGKGLEVEGNSARFVLKQHAVGHAAVPDLDAVDAVDDALLAKFQLEFHGGLAQEEKAILVLEVEEDFHCWHNKQMLSKYSTYSQLLKQKVTMILLYYKPSEVSQAYNSK
jgi:hypothetical protein